ncbi:MAG: hypothetical protein R3B89_22770 [Polyangiaceae bacterium]
MAVLEKLMLVYQCDRCGHEWVPRTKVKKLPTVCPKCKSPYWNTPRRSSSSETET